MPVMEGEYDPPIAPPVVVPCTDNTTFYWICFIFDGEDGFDIDSVPNSMANWTEHEVTSDTAGLWIDSGMPDQWAGVPPYTSGNPLLYFWIVN